MQFEILSLFNQIEIKFHFEDKSSFFNRKCKRLKMSNSLNKFLPCNNFVNILVLSMYVQNIS